MNSHFKEITITNFRGFDSLIIKQLQRINVFVGANNVGKTSILEAAFMLSGMSNPFISNRINYLRTALLNNSIDSSRYLFHNVDFSNKPLLKGFMADGKTRKITFAPVTSHNETDMSSSNSANQSTIRQLNFEFSQEENGNELVYHSKIVVTNDGNTRQETDNGYSEHLNALFIPVDKNDANATANFSTLVKHNRKHFVTNALHDFDPSIESIEALPDGLYLKIKDVKELLPISMGGDGVRRMINIISTIACEDYDIVFIDEIDNGMHYSTHKLMWRTILKFILPHDIQLFVTTHNLDCLMGLKNAMQEEDSLRKLTHVYNVAKTKNKGFQVYSYGYDELKEAIDNEIEIRR